MNETSLLRPIICKRAGKISEYGGNTEALQSKVLRNLVESAAGTEWGVKHKYDGIRTYSDFAARVGVQDYETLKGYIERMRHGESDILWKGRCKWYAKSSGTTNDKSKFIPVTAQGLQRVHYKGGYDVVSLYLRNNPKSRFFSGKGLILGGSHWKRHSNLYASETMNCWRSSSPKWQRIKRKKRKKGKEKIKN